MEEAERQKIHAVQLEQEKIKALHQQMDAEKRRIKKIAEKHMLIFQKKQRELEHVKNVQEFHFFRTRRNQIDAINRPYT